MVIWLVIGEEYSRQDGFLERYWIEDGFHTNEEAQEQRDKLNNYGPRPSNIKYRLDSIEVKDGREEDRNGTGKKYEYKGPVQTPKFRV